MSEDLDQTPDSSADYKEFTLKEDWKRLKSPEYFQYRKMWDEVPKNKVELDFPLNVDIETTDVCNLSCPMCPRTMMKNNGLLAMAMLTREEYASLVDQSAENGAKAIKLNYNGEPLAHKDIVWQVEYAKQKGILDVIMNTNATLLKKEKAEGILRAGIDGVFFSMDTISPDTYAEQRVGAQLGQVIDNVYQFIRLRNEINPGCQIRINMVMFKDPKWKAQFEGLMTMWGHLVDGIGYSPCVDTFTMASPIQPKFDGWWCSQPFQRMVLKVNGNVTVCCPDNLDEINVGNWKKQKLVDIWKGEAFSMVRRKHIEGNYNHIPLCARCIYPFLEKNL